MLPSDQGAERHVQFLFMKEDGGIRKLGKKISGLDFCYRFDHSTSGPCVKLFNAYRVCVSFGMRPAKPLRTS